MLYYQIAVRWSFFLNRESLGIQDYPFISQVGFSTGINKLRVLGILRNTTVEDRISINFSLIDQTIMSGVD